jgi:hypothetical protein
MPTTISISNQVLRERAKTITPVVSTTLSEAESFQEVNVGTDALVLTLPKITAENLGLTYTFRNTGADANNIITISPNALDAFIGGFPFVTGSTASMNRASGTVNKDFINTKATSKKGDWVTIKAVSLTNWYIQGGQGVWASEA